MVAGNFDAARAELEESAARCWQVEDHLGRGMSLRDLGILAFHHGDDDRAAELFRESLELLRPIGHRTNVAWTLLATARLARRQRDPDRARAEFQEALGLFREDGKKHNNLGVLSSLGVLERSLGKFSVADRYFRDVLTQLKRSGWTHLYPDNLYPLATLLLQSGSYRSGVRLAAAVPENERDATNQLREDTADDAAAVQMVRVALGDASFAAEWAVGRAMTLDAAVEYALSDDAR